MMRGQKVYALIGLITIFTIGQLLLNNYPTNAFRHIPPCPPWCNMTYGQVESLELTSAPLRPSAPAIAVSNPEPSKEQQVPKRYAYVYADKDTKVKVRIGYEVYQMFKDTKSLVGFSVMSNHHSHPQKRDTYDETIPELIAFVPADPNDLTLRPDPQKSLMDYMAAFKKCAQTNTCGGEEPKARQ